jgi:hypothetical protein
VHPISIDRGHARIAKHVLLIVRQQELIAKLHRAGKIRDARAARDKLYEMLNRLDAEEAIASSGDKALEPAGGRLV